MKKEFVTSTTLLNEAMNSTAPVLSTTRKELAKKKTFRVNKFNMFLWNSYKLTIEDYDVKRQHAFIERFLPRNEDELNNLLRFRKNNKQSYRLRHKKSLSEN